MLVRSKVSLYLADKRILSASRLWLSSVAAWGSIAGILCIALRCALVRCHSLDVPVRKGHIRIVSDVFMRIVHVFYFRH